MHLKFLIFYPLHRVMTSSSTDSPTLLVLAAGLGTRYGGLKQLEKIGPSGKR